MKPSRRPPASSQLRTPGPGSLGRHHQRPVAVRVGHGGAVREVRRRVPEVVGLHPRVHEHEAPVDERVRRLVQRDAERLARLEGEAPAHVHHVGVGVGVHLVVLLLHVLRARHADDAVGVGGGRLPQHRAGVRDHEQVAGHRAQLLGDDLGLGARRRGGLAEALDREPRGPLRLAVREGLAHRDLRRALGQRHEVARVPGRPRARGHDLEVAVRRDRELVHVVLRERAGAARRAADHVGADREAEVRRRAAVPVQPVRVLGPHGHEPVVHVRVVHDQLPVLVLVPEDRRPERILLLEHPVLAQARHAREPAIALGPVLLGARLLERRHQLERLALRVEPAFVGVG